MGTIPSGKNPLHSPQYRRLCRQLRAWRERAELSQRALSRALGKPHTYCGKTEAGERRIDPLELAQWTRACRVPASEVMAAIGIG